MADTALAKAPQSIEQFLADHPWTNAQLAQGKPLDFLWHFEVDAPPEKVWPHLSDTSRLNRAMGVSQMHFEERDGVLHGSTTNAGIVSEWVEVPWTWVAERTITSVRLYSRGFAHMVRAIFDIEPLPANRSRVRIHFGWIPRGWWQRILLKLGMGALEKEFEKALAEIAKHSTDAATITPFVAVAPELPPESLPRFDALSKRMSTEGVDTGSMQRLRAFILEGDDFDLYRIQVRPLARRWNMDEFQLLSSFLKATRAGLLQMSWDVICPHCRGVRSEVKTLGEVPARGDCKACGIDFDTDSENSIEITFHVHPSVRTVEQQFYCSAEPAKKAHIKLFQIVLPKQTKRVTTRLAPGRYRLRTGSARDYHLVEVRDGATASELRWNSQLGEVPVLAPNPTIALVNDTDAELGFTVEDSGWSDDALRPSQLLSFQEFRDLFTEEYLSSDVQLSVGRQTIFFSDVVGSTRLYATRGDPGAFADVKRHFTEVYDVVKKHHGAIVKTIGDAAMAAFPSPLEALEASHELQERLPPEREDLQIRVRVSLNTGPCIAVNLNTNIDYFGNTVNLAAKLQACAGAGQIAFPAEVLDHPGVRELLQREGAVTEELVFETPTVGRPMNVIRWDAFAGRPSRRQP